MDMSILILLRNMFFSLCCGIAPDSLDPIHTCNQRAQTPLRKVTYILKLLHKSPHLCPLSPVETAASSLLRDYCNTMQACICWQLTLYSAVLSETIVTV